MSDRHFSHEVWLSKLRDHLTEERYAAGTSRQCIAVARHFLRCLDKQKVDVSTAQPASVEEYLQQARRMYRRRHGHPPDYKGWQCLHTNGIHMLLRLVQGQWPPAPKAVTPVEILQSEMRGEYAQWMVGPARPRSGNSVSSLLRGRASSRLAGGASNPRGTCDPHPSRCGRLSEVPSSGGRQAFLVSLRDTILAQSCRKRPHSAGGVLPRIIVAPINSCSSCCIEMGDRNPGLFSNESLDFRGRSLYKTCWD